MVAIVETQQELQKPPWLVELDEFYKVTTGGRFFPHKLLTGVRTCEMTLESNQLHHSTVAQARHYSQIVDLDPMYEKQILNTYGILCEGRFSVPPGEEEDAHLIRRVSDEQRFALTLLFCGKRIEFDQFIIKFPNIFGVKR